MRGRRLQARRGFVDEPVTVTAEIEQVFGDPVFTLAGSDGSLLVVASTADTGLVEEGARVRVSGTISEPFSATTAESEDVDAAALSEYEGEPYLSAEVIGEPVNAPEPAPS